MKLDKLLWFLLAGGASLWGAEAPAGRVITAEDCNYRSAPDEYLAREARNRREVSRQLGVFLTGGVRTRETGGSEEGAPPVVRRNFIDDEVFGRLEAQGVKPAAPAGDAEFLRRVTLDLTGRIPSAADVRQFLADTNPGKREAVIDRLLYTPEFTAKWTNWLGDLLQVKATTSIGARSLQAAGRNAYYGWVQQSVEQQKSLKDIAWEAVTRGSNNFDASGGPANFAVNALTSMGPAQDTYDTMLVRSATAFLGMSHYDCLLCHNGRGHLTQVSAWGTGVLRADAQKMAAYFSRLRAAGSRAPQGDAYYLSTDVSDAARGQYDLNTTSGNRPSRLTTDAAGNAVRNYTPVYLATGATPKGDNWRAEFADQMVSDPMFARNFANRLWKQMFNMGLVEPVDGLDPARLDPGKAPAAPWDFQATHPVLLERLAQWMRENNWNLREYLRLIATSSAYQLSSRYEGEWKYEYLTLFARHYPRRLDAEEVHDAITKATAVLPSYTVNGWTTPVNWAMQLPDPVEPRSNGAAASFLNTFLRGNRDTTTRSQAGSAQQQLALMNDNFVVARMRVAASPKLAELAGMADTGALVDEMFLTFLGRYPTARERSSSLAYAGKATGAAARRAAVEDMAWAEVNKIEFLFSY